MCALGAGGLLGLGSFALGEDLAAADRVEVRKGERKLYLLIEGPTELTVKRAKVR